MSLDTVNAARGRWPGILAALGVDPKFLRNVHGPCPICGGGKDRFRFDDQLNGTWFCSHCVAKGGPSPDGFELLKRIHGWDFKKAASEVDRVLGNVPLASPGKPERSDSDKAKAIRRVLESSGPVVEGTAAWMWLQGRCGDPGHVLYDLRAHHGLKHSEGGTHPAMLAIMRYPDGRGASVHRTYLTPDGHKAQGVETRKIMPGFPLMGSAVRLGQVQERIGIAEGIETAISAGKIYGLPVWAAISANGIETWEPPQGVRSVVICGDNDSNFVGQAAAYTLAKRLRRSGLDVEVVIPVGIDTDWNDLQPGRRV